MKVNDILQDSRLVDMMIQEKDVKELINVSKFFIWKVSTLILRSQKLEKIGFCTPSEKYNLEACINRARAENNGSTLPTNRNDDSRMSGTRRQRNIAFMKSRLGSKYAESLTRAYTTTE